jgi:hypothetical protein
MLTIRDLKMSLGGRVLFENASFQVNYGDRATQDGGDPTLSASLSYRYRP